MDDKPTTGSDTIDLGAVDTSTAQPSDSIMLDEPAAQTPEPTTSTEATDTPAPSHDENAEWLANKGIDPTSPEAVSKLADMARNAEKRMHEATAKQSQLNEQLAQPVDPSDSLLVDNADPVSGLQNQINAMQLENSVNKFFAAGGNEQLASERKAMEPAMAKIVADKPAIGEMVRAGVLGYDELLALAKGSNPSYDANLKSAGGREALEAVATKQQARALPGNATSSAVSSDDQSDPFLDGFNSI